MENQTTTWQNGDCLKFHDTEVGTEHTGTIVRMVGPDRAIVHWDDGYRDSGINLDDCEHIA